MVVLSVIVGILLIIAGFACIFTPLATFLAAGIFLGIVLLVFGIVGIVRGFQKKASAPEVVVAVLALIIGIACLFRPGNSLEFDRIILYLIAIWFIVEGCISIYASIQIKAVSGAWVLGLIVGILAIILGIYAFAHPMFTAVATGILIGFFFIEAGIEMIVMGAAIDSADEQ